MLEQEEQRDELLEKIEDLISRKRYAELRDLLLPLEAQDIAGLFMELDDKVPMVLDRKSALPISAAQGAGGRGVRGAGF